VASIRETRKIVAIGGGEIRSESGPAETLAIDEEILRLAGKARPKLLFLPTASGDAKGYIEAVEQHFGATLGCRVEALCVAREREAKPEWDRRILDANIIYVGGGNTEKMMRIWRRLGVDRLLGAARERGVVLAGLSAGAICWFRYGCSDSRKERNPQAGPIRVRGLGLIGASLCPHFDSEGDRKLELKRIMARTSGVALALGDCCALEIMGDTYRVLTSRDAAPAYRVFWRRGEYYEEPLEPTDDFRSLPELLNK
jgi:dipeptidase E